MNRVESSLFMTRKIQEFQQQIQAIREVMRMIGKVDIISKRLSETLLRPKKNR